MRPRPTNLLCLVSFLAAGGCTWMVGAELSDKPAETAADGGQGGSGTSSSSGPTTSVHTTSGPTTTSESTTSSSTAMMCPPNMANCDGIVAHGCDVNLQNDPLHCGSCTNVCKLPMLQCAGGQCK